MTRLLLQTRPEYTKLVAAAQHQAWRNQKGKTFVYRFKHSALLLEMTTTIEELFVSLLTMKKSGQKTNRYKLNHRIN